jgi:hypothetical protein
VFPLINAVKLHFIYAVLSSDIRKSSVLMSSKVRAIFNETKKKYDGPIFWDITPCSPLKVDFQRTTRRYIPENSKYFS